MLSAFIALLLAVPVAPVVIENAGVRVEVDPQLMAVRYIGPPEGPNLVEPLHVEKRDRRLGEWLDAGGITWDLTAAPGHDAALRRGPAEVLAHTDSRIVLLAPASDASPYRLKLEIALPASRPEVSVVTTVTTDAAGTAAPVAVRCAFRVRPGALVGTYDSRSTTVYPLDNPNAADGLVINQWDGILFDAGAPGARPLIAAALGDSAVIDRHGLKLIREVEGGAAPPAEYVRAANLLAVSDPRTHTYGLVMESPRASIDIANPLVYREVWRLVASE